ncbi:MAG: hypothetical protein PHS41_10505 [Victivallaceae bacterium]|nr:hypothetical protein [Victivallaceae bacterium]
MINRKDYISDSLVDIKDKLQVAAPAAKKSSNAAVSEEEMAKNAGRPLLVPPKVADFAFDVTHLPGSCIVRLGFYWNLSLAIAILLGAVIIALGVVIAMR